MNIKLCSSCGRFRNREPRVGFFTGSKIDVLFAGHAPTNAKWFDDFPLLTQSIRNHGIESYGLTDCWKCRGIGGKDTNAAIELNPYCRHLLAVEVRTYKPTVIVAVGAAAFEILTSTSNWLYKEPGVVKKVGKMYLLPLPHPEIIDREKQWITIWEQSFRGLTKYLNGVKNGEAIKEETSIRRLSNVWV